MAITWRTKVSVLDMKRKNVSVTLEQVEDTDPDNIKVLKSFTVLDALIDTPERKQQVFDELHRQYDEEKSKKAMVNEIVGSLADDITTAVTNWEAK